MVFVTSLHFDQIQNGDIEQQKQTRNKNLFFLMQKNQMEYYSSDVFLHKRT